MTLKQTSNLACFNLSTHWFTIGTIIPVLTLILIEKKFSLIQIGIAFAIYSATIVILEIPTGGLSDSIGRKRVYQISLLFQFLSSIFLIFANTLQVTMLCFICNGIARSLSSGTMDAYFIDEFYKIDPNVNLQKEMSKIGVFIPIGLGLGSLIGGFIPITLGVLTKSSSLNSVYSSNLIVLAFLTLTQFIFTTVLIKEEQYQNRQKSIMKGFRKILDVITISINYGLKNSVILILLVSGFVWGFSVSGLEQFWQPQVKNILNNDGKTWVFGLLTCGYFIASGLGNLLISPICKILKNNYPVILFLSRLFMGILFLFLAFQISIIGFSFLYVILFMFNGFQDSPISAIFNEQISSDKRSTMLSFSSLFMQLGGLFGSIINGFLANTYSIKLAWIVASIFLLLSTILFLLIPNNKKVYK